MFPKMSMSEAMEARASSSMDQPTKYEYLDHTADVQLHSWGVTVENAIEQCVSAMYAYMTTDPATIEPVYSMDFRASGSDMCSLVYNLLDTCLYHFSTEPFFIGRTCQVLSLTGADNAVPRRKNTRSGESSNRQPHSPIGGGDRSDSITNGGGKIENEEGFEEDALKLDNYNIHIRAFGESFDTEKHPPGTEIKAITYSNLRVIEPISDRTKRRRHDSAENAAKMTGDKVYEKHDDEFNIFVIVDI